MKAKILKGGISITGITYEQFVVIAGILNTANDRCFEEQDEDGDWSSNDDFVLRLTDEQRQILRDICKVI